MLVDREARMAAGMHTPIEYRDCPLKNRCGEAMEC
jgi:hypothetical protein